MRWLRYIVGLILALTLHSLLDNFYPNALAFFNPYLILVIYYSMGGNLVGAIVAGTVAGFVQDAFTNAIFGMHAFALTLVGYMVAYVNSRIVLRGVVAFGGALAAGVIVNELLIYVLVNILLRQPVELMGQEVILKMLITALFGMLVYQLLSLFLSEEPIEATKRPLGW
ncbi:MAG: rod shape-determining protein MreD [Thermoanaerobaculia bacterium]